jgi:hypothetical protein
VISEEIKSTPESNKTVEGWLKEIAYQLALMNESVQEEITTEVKRASRPPKVKP